MSNQQELTTASGMPCFHNEYSLSAGSRGTFLLFIYSFNITLSVFTINLYSIPIFKA